MINIERKKIASIEYFKLASQINKKIQTQEDNEIKKGLIMVASQLYFYAGETGIKYLLNMGNYSIPRDDILLELKTYSKTNINEENILKLEELYSDLLPIGAGGKGLRNLGAYQGKNSNIYLAHKEFGEYVLELIKNEK